MQKEKTSNSDILEDTMNFIGMAIEIEKTYKYLVIREASHLRKNQKLEP